MTDKSFSERIAQLDTELGGVDNNAALAEQIRSLICDSAAWDTLLPIQRWAVTSISQSLASVILGDRTSQKPWFDIAIASEIVGQHIEDLRTKDDQVDSEPELKKGGVYYPVSKPVPPRSPDQFSLIDDGAADMAKKLAAVTA